MNAKTSRRMWNWLAPVGMALALFGALLTVLLTTLPARSSPLLAIGGTRYVAKTGADSGTCTSSALPCLTIAYAVSQAVSGDTISIAAGAYPEQVTVGTKVLTFIGAGAGSTLVDGSNTGRVFSITAASATFASLTIQNGYVISDSGGGIYAAGALTLTNVAVLSNTVAGNPAINTHSGGGVRVRGELRVIGGRFENNLVNSGGEGGAIASSAPAAPHPNVTISGTTFISNTAKYGGAISLAASVWLTDTQLISNTATSRGGGLFNSQGGTLTLSGGRFERNTAGPLSTPRGGGLYFIGAAKVEGTEFISNTVNGSGGGGGARIDGEVTLVDATFTGNRAIGGSGGGLRAGAGLTVTNGTFTDNSSSGTGGGVYAGSTTTVAGADFISNTGTSGGGVYVNSGGATVTGAHFISNSATTGNGGGLQTFAGALIVDGTDCQNNTAMDGGGVYAAGALTLTNSQITTNTATRAGGGIYVYNGNLSIDGAQFISNTSAAAGGGVYKQPQGNQVTITDTKFISNTAGANVGTYTGNGGGIYSGDDLHAFNVTFTGNASNWITTTAGVGGGGVYGSRLLELSGVRFENNSAAMSGGGLNSAGSSVDYTTILTDVQFINNTASDTGGGIYAKGLKALSNGTLSGNTAGYGGGLYLLGNTAGQHSLVNSVFAANTAISGTGAAMYLFGSESYAGAITILHTTVASPTLGGGSAIFVGSSPSKVIQANITNTIVASYTTGISAANPLSVTSDYNYFSNAPTAIDIGSQSISGTEHYLLFANAAAGDYRPALGSPAPTHGISTIVTTDLDGQPRSNPPTIGAYEGTPYPYLWLSKTVTPTRATSAPAVLTYTLELHNNGSLTDTVVLTDVLPASVTFGGWVVEPEGVISTSNAITWTGEMVDLTGITGVYTVTVTDPTATSIVNTAWVSSSVQSGSTSATFRLVDCRIQEVTNTDDSGAGSLRQALADACAGATVNFNLTYPATITLTSGQALTMTRDMTIAGPGAEKLAISGGGATRVFVVDSGVNATIDGLTIRNGQALGADGGAGILNSGILTVTGTSFTSNTAERGGGVYNSGALNVAGSSFISNTASTGGGVYNSGSLTVTDSSFISNTAEQEAGGLYNADGGYTVWVENCTFAANRATEHGAGLVNEWSDTAVVRNSTFVGNSTKQGAGIINFGTLTATNVSFVANVIEYELGYGGGIANEATATIYMRNILIAGTVGGNDCNNDVDGIIAENTNNLVEDGSCGAALSGDPLIGSLGDYGGPATGSGQAMLTVPLLPGSPAIDAGDAATCTATDQRGIARPVGSACDIGAFESRGFTLLLAGGDSQSQMVGREFATPLAITVTSNFTEPVDGGVLTFLGPAAGAGVLPISRTVTIHDSAAAITATANSTFGSYLVTADTAGAIAGVNFSLVNTRWPTTVTVISNGNPAAFGQPIVITATVAVTAPGAGTPTGIVTITAGTSQLGMLPLAADGVVTVTNSSLAVGEHVLTAAYSGDANFVDSRNTLTQTVNRAATTTALASTSSPAVFGQSVVFTTTVIVDAPGAGTPTGVVTFTAGVSELGTIPLPADGVATVTTSSLAVGEHTVTATYGGDSNFVNSSDTLTQTVNRAATTTALAGEPNPTIFGQPAVFTATVAVTAPGVATPTGVITFTNNGAAIAGCGALAVDDARAICMTAALASGVHTITAEYSGDAHVAAATGMLAGGHVVNKAGTLAVVTSSPNPTEYGAGATISVTVSAVTPGAGIPTGAVTFTIGAATYPATLANGAAAMALPSLGVGAQLIIATYGGDLDFLAGASAVYTHTVTKVGTTTVLDLQPNPAFYGASVLFTATVSVGTPSAAISPYLQPSGPAGTVRFTDTTGTVDLTGTLASGVATAIGGVMPAGTYTVHASYQGDAAYAGSMSNVVALAIAKYATVTELKSTGNPVFVGDALGFGVKVSEVAAGSLDANGVTGPAGSVMVTDTTGAISVTGTLANGTVVVYAPWLAEGIYTVTATYLGSERYAASSSSSVVQVVQRHASATALALTPAPARVGELIQLTATVTISDPVVQGGTIVTGVVEFLANGIKLGQATLVDGLALGSGPAPGAATYTLTAIYAGNLHVAGSTAQPVELVVVKRSSAVALTAAPNPSQVNRSIVFTATVTEATPQALTASTIYTPPQPTGDVIFAANGVEMGRSAVASGLAIFTDTLLPLGTHRITAQYVGDDAFVGAISAEHVQAVQPAPLAVNDAAGTLQAMAVSLLVLANDLDPAGGGLTVTAIAQAPSHGKAEIAPDGQSVEYTPDATFSGLDSFVYVAQDSNGNRDEGMATIIVTAQRITDGPPQIAPFDPALDGSEAFTTPTGSLGVEYSAGFVTETLTAKDLFFLSFTPIVTPSQQTQTPPANLKFGNVEFDLTAYLNAAPQHGIRFAPPVTMTLAYNPALLGGVQEVTLELFYWNGQAWSNDGIDIVARDLTNHTITFAVSHLSQFGLFGMATPTALDPVQEPDAGNARLYLPAVMSETWDGAPQASTMASELWSVLNLPMIAR